MTATSIEQSENENGVPNETEAEVDSGDQVVV
jgi:hypothetical protein